jgi:succinate-semialdehyde dehydrogenase/glutarate-semialdehyde dehydrogenase
MTEYPNTQLYIDGAWCAAASGRTHPVVNPATGEVIGNFAWADKADLDRALAAADKGFATWRKVSAYERSKIMRKAADLLRERLQTVAELMTMEQGKTVAEAKGEILNGADTIDWFAEEGRRTYGRVIPARGEGIWQLVVKEPVCPVAAFTPWNFPINQVGVKAPQRPPPARSSSRRRGDAGPARRADPLFADAGVRRRGQPSSGGTCRDPSPDPASVIRKIRCSPPTRARRPRRLPHGSADRSAVAGQVLTTPCDGRAM